MPALEQAPVIPPALVPALQALRDLEGERTLGYGVVGLIPWRAILAYAQEYHIPDRERFIELVQTGDVALLEARDAAIERNSAETQRANDARHAYRRKSDAVPRGRLEGDTGAGAAMGSRGRR